MADAISVIPHIGPIIATTIETTNIINFKNFTKIIEELDDDFKNIIYTPDHIRIIINNAFKEINENYNEIPVRKKSSQKGSGFFKSVVSSVIVGTAGNIVGNTSESVTKAVKKTKEKVAPQADMAASVASAVGLDPGINKIIDSVLTPSVHLTIKLFEILFPLFFTLLYIKDKQCKE